MVSVGRGALIALYMVVFVDLMQLTFLFSLFPKVVLDRPVSWPSWLNAPLQAGMLGSVAAVGEGIAAPRLGALSDKIGRRPIFIYSTMGCTICSVLTAHTTTYWPLYFVRFLAGIAGGTAAVAAAYIADVTEAEERGSYMTYFQVAVFGGLALGPPFGGVLDSAFGFSVTCYVAAAVSALNLLLIVLYLPESKSFGERAEIQAEGAAAEREMPCDAYAIFMAGFLNGVGFTAIEALGSLFVQREFFSHDQAGINAGTLFFAFTMCGVGVVGMIVSLILYNRVVPRTGLKGSIAFGGFFAVVALFCLGIPISRWWFLWSCEFIVFGDNIMITSMQTLVTLVVHPSMFGRAFGTLTFAQNIAKAVGPFVFAPMFSASLGKLGIVTWSHSLPFFMNSGLKAVAISLCLSVRLLKKDEEQPLCELMRKP